MISRKIPLTSFLTIDNDCCDVKILCRDGRMVNAHWAALCSRIEYFLKMKRSGMMEASSGIINIDANSTTVKFILQWLYGEESQNTTYDELFQSLDLAMLWMCNPLAR